MKQPFLIHLLNRLSLEMLLVCVFSDTKKTQTFDSPQAMGAYNSTQHSTAGVSPHMMLTRHEKSLPLTFFYPEYEGKKRSPLVYVKDVIRLQHELNDLCRQNTQQAQARQRKRFDKRAAGAKGYSVGDYVWVNQNVIPPKERKSS